MTAQVRGLTMAAKNASDALGLLKVVENATNDVTDMLQRIRELAVQAQSGTNSAGDIANLQQEANALIDEIGRVSTDTKYNGKARIGGDAATLSIQVGYNDGDVIQITTYDIKAENLGAMVADAEDVDSDAATTEVLVALKSSAGYLDISQTAEAAVAGTSNRVPGALEVITGAIEQVAMYKAEWGAGQNRLQYTVSNLMNVVEFTTAARSRIQDADFAVEAAKLAKAQVLQQTGTAMLAQANAAPQLALQLLK
jgi:flagellin